MNAARMLAAFWLAWLSAGCVSTINPLHSKDVVARDPAMEGIWFDEEGQSLSISAREAPHDGYWYTFHTPKTSETFEAELVELEGRRYLDIYSDKNIADASVVPIHNILRIEIRQNQLILAPLDIKKVQQIIKTEEPKMSVAHVGRRLVLTGSTAELQAFFIKHGGEVFSTDQRLRKGR